MDTSVLEKVLAQIDEDKRQEVYDEIVAAEDLDQVKAIVKEYDISIAKPEAILSLAREKGYELTDEELEQVAGGRPDWLPSPDPNCSGCSCD